MNAEQTVVARPAISAKLWIERDGKLLLSDYRVRLLEEIARTGSLSEGAHRMGLSYRRAWGKIREIEANLGIRLVESAAGGVGGGGSHLTAAGEELVARYTRLRSRVERELAEAFSDVFRGSPLA